MTIYNVDIPCGIRKLVVTYEFANWTGDIKRSKNYYRAKDAVESYERGIRFIGNSEDYEKVGLYYVLMDDDVLHLIQSYDTLFGYLDPGEQY